ncbi:hypothetical protein PAPYR_8933 [Paratrimastix pyriformis]|uniref:Uncharacterized protein n=1 Tax=Paratrimastix pyriformis TaxID=342808 RepID=A0ABQ8UDN2_9EUKA|nr:hypothetical protein PAPYR_8933 [Paratrimastix pyriformis]
MSPSNDTSGSLHWLRKAIKKHDNGLARRVRHHYEKDADDLRSDICCLVNFIAETAPKEFVVKLSRIFEMLSPSTIKEIDCYTAFNSDPHYRSLRDSKSESESTPLNPQKTSPQPPASKKASSPPPSDHTTGRHFPPYDIHGSP